MENINIQKKQKKNSPAFSLLELSIVISILSIFLYLSSPFFKTLIEKYKLKRLANELFLNLNRTKSLSIRENREASIFFDVEKNLYSLNQTDRTPKTSKISQIVYLKDYGAYYGYGKAKISAIGSKFPDDSVSYQENRAVFNSYGMAKNLGYVYLTNDEGISYAVGTITINGNIAMKKWNNTTNSWE